MALSILRRSPTRIARFSTAPRAIGQPAAHSHPHLVKSHELTAGIPRSEYAARRQALLNKLPEGSLVILSSASEQYMAHDIPFPFRQQPDFFYLTGFLEPDAVMVLGPAPSTDFTMLVRPRDPAKEVWDGPSAGVDGAIEFFGADKAHSIHEAVKIIESAASKPSVKEVWANMQLSAKAVTRALENVTTKDPTTALHQLRARKSPSELAVMQLAGSASAASFCDAMRMQQELPTEAALAAALEFGFKKRGAQKLAYPCVVAGGNNANTLHYISNDHPLNSGDLVLVDAGGEMHGYASDISRTWPVSGRFTAAQKDVYQVVLECQLQCIDAAVSESSQAKIHQLSVKLLCEGLRDLGLLEGPHSNYYGFYPHSIGHHLGIDVHDVPSIRANEKLVEGNVITIEPGLYIPDVPGIPAELRGIGIRIEDDVVVTPDGQPPIVMTRAVPKEVDEIEALMR